MSVARRRMLLHGKRGWSDSFLGGSLSGRWTTDHGTPAVSGGAVTGSALANDAYNLLLNPGFETGDPPSNWSGVDGGILSRVADPYVGTYALNLENGEATTGGARQPISNALIGVTYELSAYAKKVTCAARIYTLGFGNTTAATSETTYTHIAKAGVAAGTTLWPYMQNGSVVTGESARYDAAALYRQSILFYAPTWPNCRIRTIVTTPADGVCPLHIVFRLNDGLTYSMLRLTPATAGNDTAIIERVAGVETTRAAADMDFAAATEYQVRIDVRGPQINVYINGVLATSYASAVGQSYRNVGVELLDTAGWSISEFRVEEL